MRLKNRLKTLEVKHSFEPKIIVVKFGNEIFQLSCGGEEFYRLEDETEAEFIARIRRVVETRPERPPVTFLVGNF